MSNSSSTGIDELRFLSENVGVAVSAHQAEQLIAFNDLLVKWTQKFNLVSANTLSDSITRHVLDSLSVGPYVHAETDPDSQDTTVFDVLDIGSGAGLPVLPLAIAFPNLTFASVETNGKKVRFQRQVLLELGLKNVELLHNRIEQVQLTANNVISRAFTSPTGFLSIATERCPHGGQAILMLGQAELMPDVLPAPWSLHVVDRVDVPGEMAERHVAVCIRGTLSA